MRWKRQSKKIESRWKFYDSIDVGDLCDVVKWSGSSPRGAPFRRLTPGFHHNVAVLVSVAVSVTVFVKTVSVYTCRSVCRFWGVCAAVARQAQRQAAEFPAQKSGRSSRRVRTAGTEK